LLELPAPTTAAASSESAAPSNKLEGPKPKREMKDGDTIEVEGSGSQIYEIKFNGGVHYCTCPGWRNQKGKANDKRTCKHLRDTLGEAFERWRIAEPIAEGEKEKPAKAPPQVLLANKHNPEKTDPTGWWMSEKLDGVRAYWDGEELLSRLGNAFYAPEWFVAGLPRNRKLDGELWLGRERFNDTISIVKSQDLSERWRQITYVLFDMPSAAEHTFEERLKQMGDELSEIPYVRLIEQRRCESQAHLDQELKRIETLQGEGVMLRQPASKYEGKRSDTLLKVKSFTDDEAKVVDHATKGKGKYKGMAGSLVCVTRSGKQFKVGSGLTDEDRANPPPVGSIITVRYQELTKSGVPRFPTYVGPAIDKEFP
jgi:DNA ligase-1